MKGKSENIFVSTYDIPLLNLEREISILRQRKSSEANFGHVATKIGQNKVRIKQTLRNSVCKLVFRSYQNVMLKRKMNRE